MFGKLKEMAGSAATDKVVEQVLPFVNEHLSSCIKLGAPLLKQDEIFVAKVIEPAYLATVASAGGMTSLIPQFKERFSQAFFVMRDELLHFNEEGVELVADFSEKLPATLKRVLVR